ncbi:MAG: hypothetical protein ACKN9U_24270 [Pirellulaceae bacterium]
MATDATQVTGSQYSQLQTTRRRIAQLLAFALFVLGWSASLPVLAEVPSIPSVSYQFLTDPIELDWTGSPKGEIPEWSDRWMSSNRMEDRLVSVQVAAARLDAGLEVPQEFGPMVSRWLSDSPLPVLRRALVSTSLRLKREADIPTRLKSAESDGPLGAVIESQLMGWKPEAMEAVWRKRVSEGTALSPSMQLALEGLAALGRKEDLPAIEAVMEKHPEATVRREAAAAIGRIDPNRGSQIASQSILKPDTVDSAQADLLLGLIGPAPTAEAIGVCETIARSNSYPNAATALKRLAMIDGSKAREIALSRSELDDSQWIDASIDVLQTPPSIDDLPKWLRWLGNPNRHLRDRVSQVLTQLRQEDSHRPQIDQEIDQILQNGTAKAVEQSMILSVLWDRRDTLPHLLARLDDPLPDLSVSAAWATSHLAHQQSDLDSIRERLTAYVEATIDPDRKTIAPASDYHRIAHLLELMGRHQQETALPLLERFIPKESPFPTFSRCAAFWAMGAIQKDKPEATQRAAIEQRVLDFASQNPEKIYVRAIGTMALGKIGNPDSISKLQQMPEPPHSPIGTAKAWAIERLEGMAKP